jgi:hypothetical protein
MKLNLTIGGRPVSRGWVAAISGVVVVVIAGISWEVVALQREAMVDTTSSTTLLNSQARPTPAPETLGFSYNGVAYSVGVTRFSLSGDSVASATGMELKGSLSIKTRPAGLSSNVPVFRVAFAVPRTALPAQVCSTSAGIYGDYYAYHPAPEKPDYCIADSSGFADVALEVGDGSFYLQASGLKTPIVKGSTLLMVAVIDISAGHTMLKAPSYIPLSGE